MDRPVRAAARAKEGARPTEGLRAPRVDLEGITRRFGATLANDRVNLTLEPGAIHALVGENGAGKSTLMRILYGLLPPHAGRIRIDGVETRIGSPAAALRLGIGMIHQHFMLVPRMSVLENIVLGYPGQRGLGPIDRRAVGERILQLSQAYALALEPDACVETLGVGERQRVEIARLLFHGARLLICDEPTAVLAPPEVASFFDILARFRAEGRLVVLITHKLAEVLEIADRVTVLRRGRVAGELARKDFDRDLLIEWIVGGKGLEGAARREAGARPEEQAKPDASAEPEAPSKPVERPPALAVNGMRVETRPGSAALDGVTFTLHAGEILGIAGVQGNGQKELAEAISGRRLFQAGRIVMGKTAVAAGERMPLAVRPAFVPEDRHSEGLISGLPAWENLLIGHLRDAPFLGRMGYRHADARSWARPLLERFRVQPADPDAPPESLSGGNQQKLLCARELSRSTAVVVAAQPTRGVDLGSTRFLHRLLREARDAGAAVLLISADLDEILSLADRIAVLYRGRMTPPVPRSEVDLAAIGNAMMGLETGVETAGASGTASGASGTPPGARGMPPASPAPCAPPSCDPPPPGHEDPSP